MTFEEQFFGPGNRLRWDAIANGQLSQDTQRRLGPFLDDLHKNLPYILLPRVDGDGRVQWYVLCTSARACRIARDELRAFIGQSYSDFEGRPPALDQSDSIDAAVLAKYGGNAFKVEVPDRNLLEPARERLRLLMQLRQDRPTRTTSVPRPAGRILRDFEYALLASDVASASRLINELRLAGHLDALNLLFLETRRLAAGQAWLEIVGLPGLDALLRTRRPRRVTEAIISAVYNVYLGEYAPGAQATAAAERFRTEVSPRFSALYGSRDGLRGFDVTASFMISAVASDPQRFALAESILADPPTSAVEQNFIGALAGLLIRPEPEGQVDLNRAAAAFSVGDVDSAFGMAISQPSSFRRTALLLRCAREIGTLEAARTALESATNLSDEERSRLGSSAAMRTILEELRQALTIGSSAADRPSPTETAPRNWGEWLQRLDGEHFWSAAVSVAESGAREWCRDDLRNDACQIQLCADLLLAERSGWSQAALRNSAPYLIEFCLGEQPDSVFMPLYESLFLILCLDPDPSVLQVGQIARICAARLQIGLSAGDYSATVRQLSDTFVSVETPAVLGTALETLETLIMSACPSSIERLGFAVRMGTLVKKWFRRVDQADILLFNSLARDVEAPPIVVARDAASEAVEKASLWSALSGKAIAIYSLQESALKRSATIVESLTGSRVETFNDHVGGSPALRSAATTADVFVVATTAAKHAATTFIQSRRPKGAITLFPRGHGSASVLQALRDYALQLR